MKTEQRTVYITSNGKEFFSEYAALQEERYFKLSELLDSSWICWSDVSADDVAGLLIENADKVIDILTGRGES